MKQFLKEGLLWGFLLWLFGFVLSLILFPFVPNRLLGWIITPFGILLTVWVLFKKVKSGKLNHFLVLGLIWTVIAIFLDYIFIVKMFKPADGYYKLDVYLYYLLTFLLPVVTGWIITKNSKTQPSI